MKLTWEYIRDDFERQTRGHVDNFTCLYKCNHCEFMIEIPYGPYGNVAVLERQAKEHAQAHEGARDLV